MATLSVTDITKQFETPSEPLVILNGVSLTLQSGDNLVILGPSGTGKSTLLHIIGTLDEPTSGSVALDELNPFALSRARLAAFRSEKIGFVFQEHHLLPQLTALENVVMPVLATVRVDRAAEAKGMELLDEVGLADRRNHLPSQLSGGEKQRVAVARSLIRSPDLLLADEPTGSLDEKNADHLGNLLVRIQDRAGAMLICVTHSLSLASLFNRRGKLSEGKLKIEEPSGAN